MNIKLQKELECNHAALEAAMARLEDPQADISALRAAFEATGASPAAFDRLVAEKRSFAREHPELARDTLARRPGGSLGR